MGAEPATATPSSSQPGPASSSSSVRLKVTLPAELAVRLQSVADTRGIPLATLVRMLLYASLERPAL